MISANCQVTTEPTHFAYKRGRRTDCKVSYLFHNLVNISTSQNIQNGTNDSKIFL